MKPNIERIDQVPTLPARDAQAHKGSAGRVLVVGGSRAYIGAAALTANAALRGGAGLVTVAAPESVVGFILTLAPCATGRPLPGRDGRPTLAAAGAVLDAAGRADVVAVGPGLDTGAIPQLIVRKLLGLEKPLVIDADGLNNLAGLPDWPAQRLGPLVLTPHPGEMARLTGRPIPEIQADRPAAAVQAARAWAGPAGAPVVVLKGAGTVVTDGRQLYVNTTGNPGLATGGTGDVLTGLIAALIGQGLAPFEAAVLGVFVHGLAGDLAADVHGQVSLIATDLLDHIPHALRTMTQ